MHTPTPPCLGFSQLCSGLSLSLHLPSLFLDLLGVVGWFCLLCTLQWSLCLIHGRWMGSSWRNEPGLWADISSFLPTPDLPHPPLPCACSVCTPKNFFSCLPYHQDHSMPFTVGVGDFCWVVVERRMAETPATNSPCLSPSLLLLPLSA